MHLLQEQINRLVSSHQENKEMQECVWKRTADNKKAECFALEVCAATNGDGVAIERTIVGRISKSNADIVGANSFLDFGNTNDITLTKES